MEQAACTSADPDLFFPELNQTHKSNAAIQNYCFSCPVRVQCEDYRVRTGTKHGVWGGKLAKREKAD
jgi:WhiB family transcriptional regulator, redox-sensing transcriptional regulator